MLGDVVNPSSHQLSLELSALSPTGLRTQSCRVPGALVNPFSHNFLARTASAAACRVQRLCLGEAVGDHCYSTSVPGVRNAGCVCSLARRKAAAFECGCFQVLRPRAGATPELVVLTYASFSGKNYIHYSLLLLCISIVLAARPRRAGGLQAHRSCTSQQAASSQPSGAQTDRPDVNRRPLGLHG